MICAEPQPKGGWQFVLLPNRSLSWRGARWFFVSVAGVSLTIAVGFSALGFWPVLPFAGAELALLAGCLRRVQRRLSYREVVTLDSERITVERGRHCAECVRVLPRHWTRVVQVHQARCLGLRAHGELLPIAAFLPSDEQAMLAQWLHAALRDDLSAEPRCMVTQVLGNSVAEVRNAI